MFTFLAFIHDSGLVLWHFGSALIDWRGLVSQYIQQFVLRVSVKEPVIDNIRIYDQSAVAHPHFRLVAGLHTSLPPAAASYLPGLLTACLAQLSPEQLADPWGAKPASVDITEQLKALFGDVTAVTAPKDTTATEDAAAAADTADTVSAPANDVDADAAFRAISERMAARGRAQPARPARPTAAATAAAATAATAAAKRGRRWEDAHGGEDVAGSVVVGGDGAAVEEPVVMRDAARAGSYRDVAMKKKSVLASMFKSAPHGRPLVEDDLKETFVLLRNQFIQKNTPDSVASSLLKIMAGELVGAVPARSGARTFDKMVTSALEHAVRQTLTPDQDVDVVAAARAARAAGTGPYKVVFVGVNGVGKSTSLSKVAYRLREEGLSVLIAACDTFRSGAVEQLQVHGRRLNIPVYEESYRTDAASVAQHAIRRAVADKVDVVLIDTAGRMYNNGPHMQSLAKLVSVNAPDCILMVAEALVGNDSVSQLSQFNAALCDYATTADIHLVDAQVLTKFDAVGDKVGTALSLVAETGRPIAFVGVGQDYVDMEPLQVDLVTKLLLAESAK